jgi:hypothetical protein
MPHGEVTQVSTTFKVLQLEDGRIRCHQMSGHPSSPCMRVYISLPSLRAHFAEEHQDSFCPHTATCPGLVLHGLEERKAHLVTFHADGGFACEHCTKVMLTLEKLQDHKNKCHQGFFKCLKCSEGTGATKEEKWGLISSLRNHCVKHSADKKPAIDAFKKQWIQVFSNDDPEAKAAYDRFRTNYVDWRNGNARMGKKMWHQLLEDIRAAKRAHDLVSHTASAPRSPGEEETRAQRPTEQTKPAPRSQDEEEEEVEEAVYSL